MLKGGHVAFAIEFYVDFMFFIVNNKKFQNILVLYLYNISFLWKLLSISYVLSVFLEVSAV